MKVISKLLLCSLGISILFGCSHRLEVRNLHEYENLGITPLKSKVSFGLMCGNSDVNVAKIVKSVADELKTYASEVTLPYMPNSQNKADVVAKVSVNSEYAGSGWNFLINFPGFIIFAPAWHGYNYRAQYNVTVALMNGKNNQNIDEFAFPIELKFKHSEIDRTWTQVSWLEVGVIAFIGGLYVMSYDSDVTHVLVTNTKKVLGEYISQKIIARVNASGQFGYIFDPYEKNGSLAKIR